MLSRLLNDCKTCVESLPTLCAAESESGPARMVMEDFEEYKSLMLSNTLFKKPTPLVIPSPTEATKFVRPSSFELSKTKGNK